MDNRIKLIKNRIIDLGCDCWITSEDFVLLKDGFLKTLPIINTLNLIGDNYPMCVDTVAKLCVSQHQTSKILKMVNMMILLVLQLKKC